MKRTRVIALLSACALVLHAAPAGAAAVERIGTSRSDTMVDVPTVTETFRGLDGADTITGGRGDGESRETFDTVDGGAGLDRLFGFGDIFGGPGTDLIETGGFGGGWGPAATVDCGPGEDVLWTGGRYSTPFAQHVNCEFLPPVQTGQYEEHHGPMPTSTLVRSGEGGDVLRGDAGSSLVVAGAGDDILVGETDGRGDLLLGGAGDDVIDTGPRSHAVSWDASQPYGSFGYGHSSQSVGGGPGDDVIIVRTRTVEIQCGAGDDTLLVLEPILRRVADGTVSGDCERVVSIPAETLEVAS